MAKEELGRLKALSHPLRAEILAFLNANGAASPAEMDRAGVGSKVHAEDDTRRRGKIAYHCRTLEELGCVESVETHQREDATEHVYRAVTKMLLDIQSWARLPRQAREGVSVAALTETIELASRAVRYDTIESFDERAVINLTLRLDDVGFIQLADDITELMHLCELRQVEAVQRVGGDMDKLMHASTSLLLYESPPPKGSKSSE